MPHTIGIEFPDELHKRVDAFAIEHALYRSEAVELLVRRGLRQSEIVARRDDELARLEEYEHFDREQIEDIFASWR